MEAQPVPQTSFIGPDYETSVDASADIVSMKRETATAALVVRTTRYAAEAAAAEAARVAAAEAAAKVKREAAALAAKKAATQAPKTVTPPKAAKPVVYTPSSGRGGQLVAYAMAQQGKPYVWGTVGPNSFDCSGLVVAAYSSIGVKVPHQTGDLTRLNGAMSVSRAQLQPGDMVFPHGGHVGIYIGGGKVVHAPTSGDVVKVTTIEGFGGFGYARRY